MVPSIDMSVRTVLLTIIWDLGVYWKTIVFILSPVLLLPLPLLLPSSASNCGYVLSLMAVYWIAEVIPLPVTALMPLVLFPLLGVMGGKEVASEYITDTSIVFIGGLMMALAIEKCNLHKRIGLRILILLGSGPTRLLIGFMLPTWFLSMWISNTATTAMMIPVAEAVISQLREGVRQKREKNRNEKIVIATPEEENEQYKMAIGSCNYAYGDDDSLELTYFGGNGESTSNRNSFSEDTAVSNAEKSMAEMVKDSISGQYSTADFATEESENAEGKTEKDEKEIVDEKKDNEKIKKFGRLLSLAVAYSSNVGGTATLTGTATNLLVANAANDIWNDHGLDPPLTYTTWLFFGLPHSVICLVFVWAWLQLVFMGWRPFCFCCVKDETPHNDDGIRNALIEEYDKLGTITFGEVSAIIFLVLLVALWFSRDPGFAPGYASLFKDDYVTDGVPAMLVSIILFAWPSQIPKWLCFRSKDERRATRVPAMLDWQTVSTKLPWGPLLLLGGGFALAKGCEVSGLSELIGEQLAALGVLPAWAIALIITIMVSFITEITSNSAVISLMLPILAAMANDLEINPLYLMLPAGMAASYAFMLPIATPPNAIVFSYGYLKIIDMASVGFGINLLCILVVTLGINTWGMAMFNLDEIPWAAINNSTGSTYYLATTIA